MADDIKVHSAHNGTQFVYVCPVCKARGGAFKFEGDAKARKNIQCHISKTHYGWWLANKKKVRF